MTPSRSAPTGRSSRCWCRPEWTWNREALGDAGETLFDQEPVATIEALEHAMDGPAFTIDDVIEFHFLLEDERYLNKFLAGSDES